jgi:hypothetical protein
MITRLRGSYPVPYQQRWQPPFSDGHRPTLIRVVILNVKDGVLIAMECFAGVD